MTKTLLYNSNPSVNNADWHLIVSNDFTKRSVDYLYQKYKLPSFITPYLMYKGVNLDEFDIDVVQAPANIIDRRIINYWGQNSSLLKNNP